jgi:uncharacterized protein (TIGR00369 family)
MAEQGLDGDPQDGAAAVRASFARQGMMDLLGARLALVEPGTCVIELPFRPELSQQDGFFHAGALTTIADSAAGYAALSLMPPGARVLTVELKINLLAPGVGELALARGLVQKAGRTLTVVQSEVLVRRGAEETRVALMLATMIALPAGGRPAA